MTSPVDGRHTRLQSLITSLSFDQLLTFQVLGRAGSFRAAAAELALTQPAVSQRVRHLERLLGCVLLDRRKGTRAQLTPAGRELMGFADDMLARVETFHRRMEQMKALPDNTTITVVSDSDHIKYLLVEAVLAMRDAAPAVDVVIRHEPSRDACVRELAEGRANIGICRYPAPSEFGCLGTIEERMYLYARPEDPILALPPEERIEHLARSGFATFCEGMRSRELVERWAEKVGASLRIVLESRGLEAMRTYVTRGLALAVLPEFCVVEDLTLGNLQVVDIPGLPLVRGAVILTPPQQELSQAVRLFLRVLPAEIDMAISPVVRESAAP
ncbi:LysR family transcriptional regulator [Kineococcus arenarius]|uniref:LysR family transcriptional regulator n=1 Tax=unclassified Kineococcus TaxID=2621656 RepID=UPI003D7EC533